MSDYKKNGENGKQFTNQIPSSGIQLKKKSTYFFRLKFLFDLMRSHPSSEGPQFFVLNTIHIKVRKCFLSNSKIQERRQLLFLYAFQALQCDSIVVITIDVIYPNLLHSSVKVLNPNFFTVFFPCV